MATQASQGNTELCCGFVQSLSILVSVEQTKFSRRVPALLPLLTAVLQKGVQFAQTEQESEQTRNDAEATACVSGWQEVYACLLLLEKIALMTPSQVLVLHRAATSFVFAAATLYLAFVSEVCCAWLCCVVHCFAVLCFAWSGFACCMH